MPRVTVKGLTLENEQLEYEITLLKQENDVLKTELDSRRDRSRSRHRKAAFKVEPISARTMMALDIVCKRDRDHVIDEQKKIMTEQAKEIERLKRGEGLVKPVLCAAFDLNPVTNCMTTETVREYVKRVWSETERVSMGILVGNTTYR